jgi:hypothetical protein
MLGDGVCPADGSGRSLTRSPLAGIWGTDLPRCDSRPGTTAAGLIELAYEERRALRAALNRVL